MKIEFEIQLEDWVFVLSTGHQNCLDTYLIRDQNVNAVSRIVILQKKTLRIMNFQSRGSQLIPLFKSNHILKLED